MPKELIQTIDQMCVHTKEQFFDRLSRNDLENVDTILGLMNFLAQMSFATGIVKGFGRDISNKTVAELNPWAWCKITKEEYEEIFELFRENSTYAPV
jgi:hypothetical protein